MGDFSLSFGWGLRRVCVSLSFGDIGWFVWSNQLVRTWFRVCENYC
jgi:hypothetical protein